MKRIAVVGSGISGLSAAWVLSRRHEVHLFERETRLGGHTHTVTVEGESGPLALDTGFLVHNDRTYPNLVRLFEELGVGVRASDMSFAVSCAKDGLEYSSRGANGFFAQRRNAASPRHLKLFGEILRFNRKAPLIFERPDAARLSLGDFLDEQRFGRDFTERYLFPMASAIWSASLSSIRAFPALTLVRFLDNHGLLAVAGQPVWKTVEGGSHTYVPKLLAPLGGRVHRGTPPLRIARDQTGATLSFLDRPAMRFDDVVFACHGDEVLPLLADPTDRERDVFAAFTTTRNVTWLHTDGSVLPKTPAAQASWNYVLDERGGAPPTVTYDLNRLQGIPGPTRYCVTLNPNGGVDESRVLARMVYRHPLFTREAVLAQTRWSEVSGVNRTHYCGAYWRHGFHEDGLVSALRVAGALGVTW